MTATVNYARLDRLYCFLTFVREFEPQRMYSKYEALTLTHFDVDFEAAAAELRRKGYR